MESKIIRNCDSFDRSLVFWSTNSADIPTTSDGTKYVTKLGADLQLLDKLGARQKSISVAAQNAAVLDLDQELENMATTADAVADLQAKVDAIGTVTVTHEQSREQGVGSTKAIAELVRDGKTQLKHLDALAKNVYKKAPEKLRAWESARHVEHGPHHPAATPTPTATATAK